MVYETPFLILIIPLGIAILTALHLTYFLQIKEYRWDRMRSWLIHNRGLYEIVRLPLRRPRLTIRSSAILTTTVFLAYLYYFYIVSNGYNSYWFSLFPLATTLGVALGVIWTRPVISLIIRMRARKARVVLDQIHPTVIAITGSFGKTSAKHFLATLLNDTFSIVTTKNHENTFPAIVSCILTNVTQKTQILIIEAGAYRRGELTEIAQLIHPTIGWITGIGTQHLDLFGGVHNLKAAKFELIQALPELGVAVFNGDSIETRALAAGAMAHHLTVITYGIENQRCTTAGTVSAVTPQSFTLTTKLSGKTMRVEVPLRGRHLASNVLGAMVIASHLGIAHNRIGDSVSRLTQPPDILALYHLRSGTTVLDNSYSTNPEGFLASAEYLRLFPGRNFIVTPGIIELGTETRAIHRELGRQLSDIETIFVTNRTHGKHLAEGGAHVVTEENPVKLYTMIQILLGKGDTLLIEGRIPSILKRKLLAL